MPTSTHLEAPLAAAGRTMTADPEEPVLPAVVPALENGPASAVPLSKVRSPFVRESTIARGRLHRWLDEHAEDRLVLIAAEAGYGKSTLLADWARRRPEGVAWLRLDSSDGEWMTLIAGLIAAFREVQPGIGQASERLLARAVALGTTPEQAMRSFLAELGRELEDRTVLILDDIHLIADRAEAGRVLALLVERGPESVRVVMSGRARPTIPVGRLAAEGSIAELDTDALRFSGDEMRSLFALGYGLPLSADLLAIVGERTEGWVASLQLLHSSLRDRPEEEVRSFVRDLRGTDAPIYDYLAEEVLGRQDPRMRLLLTRAALLDRIRLPLAVAALARSPEPLPSEAVAELLDRADDLGLMSRSARGSASRRFHPLLRDFLLGHLRNEVRGEELRTIHRDIAEAVEPSEWPTAAHHFIEAGDPETAMRVIGASSFRALGSGTWGPALELVERMPEVEPAVGVLVLRARSLAAGGDPRSAVGLLEPLPADTLEPEQRTLVHLALASSYQRLGEMDRLLASLDAIIRDPEVTPLLAQLARAWRRVVEGEALVGTERALRALADEFQRDDLALYEGITRHNRAGHLLAIGDHVAAANEAREAIDALGRSGEDEGISASTQLVAAAAAFDAGDFVGALDISRAAAVTPDAQPDAVAEAALIAVFLGDVDLSRALWLASVDLAAGPGGLDPSAEAVALSGVYLALAEGRLQDAERDIRGLGAFAWDPNHDGLLRTAAIQLAFLSGDRTTAASLAQQARKSLGARGSARFLPIARLLEACAEGSLRTVVTLVADTALVSDAHLLICADILVECLGPVSPPRIERLARIHPKRWRPGLRRTLQRDGGSQADDGAAALLSAVGEEVDIELLEAWERVRHRQAGDRRLARSLARRQSPTLIVHDLGRSSIAVGDRVVAIGSIRRRAAALLLYLVTRPGQSATREQVMEALWPDADADQATNSLHQTLYFLRREISPEDDVARLLVDFVPMEGELVYLEPDLVQVRSAAFLRQATSVMAPGTELRAMISLAASYTGRFAPEFEYEEWSESWRQRVHTAFLRLTEEAALRAMSLGRPGDATAVLTHALTIDPEALELYPALIRALRGTGSLAASREAYAHFATAHRDALDEEPPPYEEVVADEEP